MSTEAMPELTNIAEDATAVYWRLVAARKAVDALHHRRTKLTEELMVAQDQYSQVCREWEQVPDMVGKAMEKAQEGDVILPEAPACSHCGATTADEASSKCQGAGLAVCQGHHLADGLVPWEEPQAPPAPTPKSMTDQLMDCVDRLGHEAAEVDPRAWDHLLVYVPDDKILQRGRHVGDKGTEAAQADNAYHRPSPKMPDSPGRWLLIYGPGKVASLCIEQDFLGSELVAEDPVFGSRCVRHIHVQFPGCKWQKVASKRPSPSASGAAAKE